MLQSTCVAKIFMAFSGQTHDHLLVFVFRTKCNVSITLCQQDGLNDNLWVWNCT